MSEYTDLLPDPAQEDPFEVQMRGYSRRQVDEFVARSRSHIHDLEDRLSRSIDEAERLRLELSTARQAAGTRPVHEELSERIGQILKLADDEATAQKSQARDDIATMKADAQKTADTIRDEAKDQADRMMSAAQEQSDRTLATTRSEAEKMRSAARIDADRVASESRKTAETTIASAKAQAKQMLDEATARASAIHDGAERRLDLLKNRHSEAMRRLTEIRDVVTDLVAHDDARGSLDEEVDKAVAAALGHPGRPAPSSAARGVPPKGKPEPGQPADAPSAPDSASRNMASQSSMPDQPLSAPPMVGQPGSQHAEGGPLDPGGLDSPSAQRARHAAPRPGEPDSLPPTGSGDGLLGEPRR